MSEYHQRRCIHEFSDFSGNCLRCEISKKDWLAAQRIPEWVRCKHEFVDDKAFCLHCNKLYSEIHRSSKKVDQNPVKTLKFCAWCGGKIVNNYCGHCQHFWSEEKPQEVRLDPLIKTFKATIERCRKHIENIQDKCAHEYKYHSDIKGDNGYGREYVIRERVICVKCEKLSERSLSGNIGPKTGFE